MIINLNLRNAREERPSESCDVMYVKVDKSKGGVVYLANVDYSKKYDDFNALDSIDSPPYAFNENIEDYEIYWAYISDIEKEIGGNLNENIKSKY